MNDTSVQLSEEFQWIMRVIADYNTLVDRAKFILESYLHQPYVHVAEKGFARLRITVTGHVEVSWPELSEGYYNSSSMETQHAKIEPTLFVKSIEELEKLAANALLQEQQRNEEKLRRQKVMQRALDENIERAELARLKAKYEDVDKAHDKLFTNPTGDDHDNS